MTRTGKNFVLVGVIAGSVFLVWGRRQRFSESLSTWPFATVAVLLITILVLDWIRSYTRNQSFEKLAAEGHVQLLAQYRREGLRRAAMSNQLLDVFEYERARTLDALNVAAWQPNQFSLVYGNAAAALRWVPCTVCGGRGICPLPMTIRQPMYATCPGCSGVGGRFDGETHVNTARTAMEIEEGMK